VGGGLYHGVGGGLYAGAGTPYMSNHPPLPDLLEYLRVNRPSLHRVIVNAYAAVGVNVEKHAASM
jgi:hypothetical protein